MVVLGIVVLVVVIVVVVVVSSGGSSSGSSSSSRVVQIIMRENFQITCCGCIQLLQSLIHLSESFHSLYVCMYTCMLCVHKYWIFYMVVI